MDQEPLTAHYGGGTSNVLANSQSKREAAMYQARVSFALATGRYALTDSGQVETEAAKDVTKELFQAWYRKYYGATNRKAAEEYRATLKAQAEELIRVDQGIKTERAVSLDNRASGRRPHRPNPQSEASKEKGYKKLNTRERLRAIHEDKRAEFYPLGTKAKDRVISWLDYFDNPVNQLGINDQLLEVYTRGQWPMRKSDNPHKGPKLGVRYGIRAVESVTWEVGDDAIEVARRQQSIAQLREALDQDQRPSLSLFDELSRLETAHDDTTLQELFGEHAFGLAAYVQFLDIEEFIETGTVAGLIDSPLRDSEDPPSSQRPKDDATPGKRKTVLNQYTRPDILESYKTHIIARLKDTTIAQARRDLPALQANLEKYYDFLDRRLTDISQFKVTHNANAGILRPIRVATDAIRQQLNDLRPAA
jgi:hypothetical protein